MAAVAGNSFYSIRQLVLDAVCHTWRWDGAMVVPLGLVQLVGSCPCAADGDGMISRPVMLVTFDTGPVVILQL